MNDQDDLARRLLAPLAGEPAGPSTVDIRRAMAEGRRRLRTRRVAGVSVAAAMTVLVAAGVPVALDATRNVAEHPPPLGTPSGPATPTPAGPAPPDACEREDLAVPDEAYQSLVSGGDPTGRFILGVTYFWDAPAERVVVWDGGEPIPVEVPGEDPGLDDINSSGVGVGSSFLSDENQVSWLYQDGAVQQLPDGYHAIAINEQGAIAGSVGSHGQRRPAVLRSPAADPEELSVPGPSWDVTATDVGADGTVVGNGYDLDQVPRPPDHGFVWSPDGIRRQLPAPLIDGKPSGGFLPHSIRDGVVTGLAIELLEEDDGFTYRLFEYELRTGEFTDLSAHASFVPYEWNSRGWMVGYTEGELLLQAGPVQVPLPHPELPENPEDRFLNLPTVELLSDDGRTVAGDVRVDETPRAVVWRCE